MMCFNHKYTLKSCCMYAQYVFFLWGEGGASMLYTCMALSDAYMNVEPAILCVIYLCS